MLFSVTAAATVAGTLYLPILMGEAIDHIIGPGQVHFTVIGKILLSGVAAAIVTGLAQWIMNICNNRITFHVTRDIRNRAIEKIEILPLKYVDGHSYGDVVSRVIADVDRFARTSYGFHPVFHGSHHYFRNYRFYVLYSCVDCSAGSMSDTDIFICGAIYRQSYLFYVPASVGDQRGQETALTEEMMEGQKIVKAFGYEQRAQERFDEINERLRDCSLQATFYSSLTNPCTRFVNRTLFMPA